MKLFSLLNGVSGEPEHQDKEPEGPQLRPTEFAPIVDPKDVDKYRRLNCKYYEPCLDIVIQQGWTGFHCNDCKAYVQISKEKQRQAARGLLAIFDQGKAADED